MDIAELVICFFLFASCASFGMAGASRMVQIQESLGSDEEGQDGLLPDLLRPSRCLGCGMRLGVLDMVPAFSCLFLRGRCRYCGELFGFSHFAAEAGMGMAGVFTGAFLAPRWVSLGPLGLWVALFTLALALSFLLQAALTDMKTGYVWDFSGLWCAVFSMGFLYTAGGTEHVILLCVAGWGAFIVAMTGRAGYGDAAPLGSALALSSAFYPVQPFTAEAVGVYSAFFFVLGLSGITGALLARRRGERASWGGAGTGGSASFGKMEIPLVPHILLTLAILALVSPFAS